MTHDLPEIGQRIRLIEMPNDPCPIPPGTEGTVSAVLNPDTPSVQICVKWDIARSLMLIPGVDRWEKIGTDLSTLRKVVTDNLDAALANGYYVDLDTLTTQEIAIELTAFAEDCQDIADHLLLPHVEAWIAARKEVA